MRCCKTMRRPIPAIALRVDYARCLAAEMAGWLP